MRKVILILILILLIPIVSALSFKIPNLFKTKEPVYTEGCESPYRVHFNEPEDEIHIELGNSFTMSGHWHDGNNEEQICIAEQLFRAEVKFNNTWRTISPDTHGLKTLTSNSLFSGGVMENPSLDFETPSMVQQVTCTDLGVYPIRFTILHPREGEYSTITKTVYCYDSHAEIGWTARLLDNSAAGVYSVYATDLDNDSDVDIIAPLGYDSEVVWYDNQGGYNPEFIKRFIDIGPPNTGALTIYSADLDRDGDQDVVTGLQNDEIHWYENLGGVPLNWNKYVISTSVDWVTSVFAIDMDDDGDMDVLSASRLDDKIAWYENDGTPENWTQHVISNNTDEVKYIHSLDMDDDGDMDVLSASFYKIEWYENMGREPDIWIKHLIGDSVVNARSIYSIDMDDDGDMDVLSASLWDDKLSWYESNGKTPINWTEHEIDVTEDNSPISVFAKNLDFDEDIDVLSTSYWGTVLWYENGNNSFPQIKWTKHIIDTGVTFAHSVYAKDIDGDMDFDIVASGYGDKNIYWYQSDLIQFQDGPSKATEKNIFQTIVDFMKSIFNS